MATPTTSNLPQPEPPLSYEAEALVIGGLLHGTASWSWAISLLQEQDFYSPVLRRAYHGVTAAYRKHGTCTVPLALVDTPRSLSPDYEDIDAPFLKALERQHLGDVTFRAMVDETRDNALRRRLWVFGEDLARRSCAPDADGQDLATAAASGLREILGQSGKALTGRILAEEMDDWFVWQEEVLERPVQVVGPFLALPTIDRAFGGLAEDTLVIVKGDTGFGKSSLLVQMVGNYALVEAGEKEPALTLVFSLEDYKTQWLRRFVCWLGEVDNHFLKSGRAESLIAAGQRERYLAAKEKAKMMPVVLSNSRTIEQIELEAHLWAGKRRVGAVVIDYVQCVGGGDRRVPREERISEYMDRFEALAIELQVPVILSSQVTKADDGTVQARNARAIDDASSTGLVVVRGDPKARMSADQRRQCPEAWLMNTKSRRDALLSPVECSVVWSRDRWQEVGR